MEGKFTLNKTFICETKEDCKFYIFIRRLAKNDKLRYDKEMAKYEPSEDELMRKKEAKEEKKLARDPEAPKRLL